MVDPDFEIMVTKGYSLVTVNVIYYLPDYNSLVNEFLWQSLDLRPKYPRIQKFLQHWQNEIDAVIKEIQLTDSFGLSPRKFRKIEELNMGGLFH